MISVDEALQKNAKLEAEVTRLARRNEELSAQVEWFKKQLFGQKSERRVAEAPKEQLYLGELFQSTEEEKDETQTIPEHQRKKRRTRSEDDEQQELFFDDSVPVEEIRIENPETLGLSDVQYEVINQKVSFRLAQRPGAYVILKYIRDVVRLKPAVADKADAIEKGELNGVEAAKPETVEQADAPSNTKIFCPPAPVSVFEKSHADASFLAGLLIDKFQFHLPLYRQHQRLESAGINVSRAWLTQLVHRCGNLLEPIFDAHVQSIRESRIKLMDETPIKAGRKEKGKMNTAYFWPVMGGDRDIAFLYFKTREHHHVFEALGETPGVGSAIVSDGYGAYKAYAKATGTLNPQCWTHTRREFVDAESAEPKKSETALNLVRPLWEIEKEIKKQHLQGEAKRLFRVEHSKPVADRFFAWVEQQLKETALLPSDRFIQGLKYASKRKAELLLFLEDPDIPIDTSEIERALRVIAVGRKNWLFCWTEVGAKYVGIFQSLIVSCKMNGIAPYTYLVDVLQRVATHPSKDTADLTPRRWKQLFADNPLRSDLDRLDGRP